VNEFFEGETYGGFETEYAERRFVELHIFNRRFVGGVIGGDGVNGAVGEAG